MTLSLVSFITYRVMRLVAEPYGEGLYRVLEFLKEKHLQVGILVTDRHQQITKWMREEHPSVKHYFDVWHVAKGECMCPHA